MKTKIEQIRNKLAEVYFQKTGEVPSNNSLSLLDFYEKIREDVSNYLVDTLDINADELIFTYFFDVNLIKELIDLYFEVNKIKVKDIKNIRKQIINLL